MLTIPSLIIYHCYGGAHSSVTAAAVHVGLLARDKTPSRLELVSLPYFDAQKAGDHGFLQYMGKSKDGSLIYSVGFETASAPVIKAVKNLFSLGKASIGKVDYVETRPIINKWMIIGGICSRLLGLTVIGRPLVTWGTQLAYKKIVRLVEETEEKLKAEQRQKTQKGQKGQ
ncbi:MAG: DUF3189 family protein [Eubacteriales bacterium]|nr:DUF3189 family protein [Eubacteriales bacterium]MDD3073106.1 DUF3189 family protein [Eubacteriales bacterium]MDD4078288.1 DUF3189 family protein [Eubacteriales bacterium]MDD4769042.1 DUF3189 family protein [Eubacteriales bacterium]